MHEDVKRIENIIYAYIGDVVFELIWGIPVRKDQIRLFYSISVVRWYF